MIEQSRDAVPGTVRDSQSGTVKSSVRLRQWVRRCPFELLGQDGGRGPAQMGQTLETAHVLSTAAGRKTGLFNQPCLF